MKDTILITGASSGIGYEMAVLLASQKFDLVLVARQSEKLQQIKTKLEQAHNINVHVFSKDLSDTTQAMELYESLIGPLQ